MQDFSRASSSPLSEDNVRDLNGTCNIDLSKILQGETSNEDDVALAGSAEEFTSRTEESAWNMDSNYDDFKRNCSIILHLNQHPETLGGRNQMVTAIYKKKKKNKNKLRHKVGGKQQMLGSHYKKRRKQKVSKEKSQFSEKNNY